MSRASNLAGFTTAVGPPTDLNVGVISATSVSAQTITSTDTYSFTNLDISETISVGSSIVGVTTINSSGINSPLGISTLGQVEIAGITTINSSGINSPLGIGTFGSLKVRDGTDSSRSIEIYPNVGGLGFQRIISFNRATTQYETLSIGVSSFTITEGSTADRFRITPGGNVGLSTLTPKTDLDISQRTGSIALPVGTTAQRPSTAYGGYIRWNSTSSALEVYNGTNWVEIISDYFPSGSTTLG